MVKTIFGKRGKSLVFPVHCRGYIGINYTDYFPTTNDDPDTYGIYSLKDESFTLEAYITPYDSSSNSYQFSFGRGPVSSSSTAEQKYKLSNNETDKVLQWPSRLLGLDADSGAITTTDYFSLVENLTSSDLGVAFGLTDLFKRGRVLTIFHNKHLNLSLVNNMLNLNGTLTPDLMDMDLYSPSSYRLRATIFAGGGYDTLYSENVFVPDSNPINSWSSTSPSVTSFASDRETIYEKDSKRISLEPIYYAQTRYSALTDKEQLRIKRKTANVAGIFEIQDRSSFSPSIDSDAKTNLTAGMELYTYKGERIGKIVDVGDAVVGLGTREFQIDDGDSSTYTDDWSSGYQSVYAIPKKESTYMFNSHMVAISFNIDSGRMALFYNGKEVASKRHKYHPDSGETEAVTTANWGFNIHPSNCYIGKNVEHDTWDVTTGSDYLLVRETGVSPLRTQFFGEFHELAISKVFKKSFSPTQQFEGKYDNLLLYYQFDGGNT